MAAGSGCMLSAGMTGDNQNDVWRSRDGGRWERVAVVPPVFSTRRGHQAVSWRGSLWVVGGTEGGDEVWRSLDGTEWTAVTVTGFSGRWGASGGCLWG